MLRLAFRNVLRHKRRTIITFFLVLLSALLITTLRFFAYGIHEEMLGTAIRVTSGYIQIAANGWLENRPIERALDVTPQMMETIQATEGVRVISPRIEGAALIGHANNSAFVSVVAADPEKEKEITSLHRYPIRGKFLYELKENHIRKNHAAYLYNVNVGETLANNLELEIGSEISLVSSQFDGSVGAILCRVVGIYKTQHKEIDQGRIYIPLEGGQDLFGLGVDENGPRRFTSLVIGVKDVLAAGDVYESLREKFPTPVLPPDVNPEDSDNYLPVVHFWPELIPGLAEIMEFDDIQNNFSWSFLILIMAFGVLNTVQMSIQERTREFGILMAIGTRQINLLVLILLEMLIILIPGLLLGSLGAIAVGSYLHANPIELSAKLSEAYTAFGIPMPRMLAIVNFRDYWIGVISLFAPSLILSSLAARRIYKINPVEVIASY